MSTTIVTRYVVQTLFPHDCWEDTSIAYETRTQAEKRLSNKHADEQHRIVKREISTKDTVL